MTKKFYRAKKDSFMWEEGAVLEFEKGIGTEGGYEAINDLYSHPSLNGEYISSRIIENNPDWFERVYEVNLLTKVVYETKEKAKELLSKNFKSE